MCSLSLSAAIASPMGGDERQSSRKRFANMYFTGRLRPVKIPFHRSGATAQLARLFALSDLHIYLTVPFVLSWSIFNALSCEATVLASNTEPVREIITHDETGLLADFFDVEGLANSRWMCWQSQGAPALGQDGRRLVEDQYSLHRTLPQMLKLYERVLQ